jgi:hypothetical protein
MRNQQLLISNLTQYLRPHTFELDLNLAVDEFIPFENFTESSPFVSSLCTSAPTAERQTIVVVGFLRIVVGPHLVYPQHHLVSFSILQISQKGAYAVSNAPIRK